MPEVPERPWDFRVATGERPPTTNRDRSLRYQGQAGAAQATTILDGWKEATHAGLMDAGLYRLRLDRIRLEVHPIYPGGNLPDADNLAVVAKAVQDAVVDAGVVADDNPHHAEAPVIHDPKRRFAAEFPMLVVELVPLKPVSGHSAGECNCGKVRQQR